MKQDESVLMNRSSEAKRVTWIGFIVNTVLTIIKITAGTLGRSEAMLADGIHSLSDFFTDIVVLIGFRFTEKPADEGHNFGHGKYETLVTMIIGVALLFAGFNIFQKGFETIKGVIFEQAVLVRPGMIALVAALSSIIMKEALYRYTKKVGERIKSPAVVANGWHHRSDAFSSVGTLFGISCAYFLGNQWIIFDPIAAVIVSAFIIKVAFSIMIPAVKELLEASLDTEEVNYILNEIDKHDKVIGYHNLRTRRLGPNVAIEAHLLFDNRILLYNAHEISELIERELKYYFGNSSIITFHLEPSKALQKSI